MARIANTQKKISGLQKESLLNMYRNMVTSRHLDHKMLIMLKQGKSFFHIGAAGHEAVQTAAAFAMQPGYDYAFPYYRDLSFVLQFGVTPKEIMLNFLAKEADPSSGGRQMPNHYGHQKQHIISQSSPTGTQYLQAVGVAMAARKKGLDEVVYASSGEGTTSQGDSHEALNWASREKLPVIFVIQNNRYAISVPVADQMAGGSVYKLTAGYKGLNRYKVDGTDFMASYKVLKKAVEDARLGKGPALIEADTVRLFPHSSSDSQKKYRPAHELEEDSKQDPIPKFEAYLIDQGLSTKDELEQINAQCKELVEIAADEAEAAADPQPDRLSDFIFAPEEENTALQFSTEEP